MHLYTVFTENINWDEFALLERAEAASRTGVLAGGGRPGLGTLILIPFARACSNAAEALLDARLLWSVFAFGAAAGFFLLLHQTWSRRPGRWLVAATGLALWVLTPAFLRYSLQVRTDQPAIFFGLWGGVTLLASRPRPGRAALSGIMFGVGFLFSQKVAYVAGLVGVLAVTQLLIRRELRPGRESVRVLLATGAFGLTVFGYGIVMASFGQTPELIPVGGPNAFAYYREFYGWAYYRAMIPTLLPQLAALALLPILSVFAVRRAETRRRELMGAWGVAIMGLAVAGFHAARFPYFWMVLGLFPATVGALVVVPLVEGFPKLRIAVGIPVGMLLIGLALAQSAALTVDTVSHQVATIDFVAEAFESHRHGFEGTGVFACRHEPDPFPVRFRQHLYGASAERGDRLASDLISEFRRRPVTFMIPPGDFYPARFHEFWQAHYVLYDKGVWVPGRSVGGGIDSLTFTAVVTGVYRWVSVEPSAPRLGVGARLLAPADTITLLAGTHELRLPSGGAGRLLLSLEAEPIGTSQAFYRPF